MKDALLAFSTATPLNYCKIYGNAIPESTQRSAYEAPVETLKRLFPRLIETPDEDWGLPIATEAARLHRGLDVPLVLVGVHKIDGRRVRIYMTPTVGAATTVEIDQDTRQVLDVRTADKR